MAQIEVWTLTRDELIAHNARVFPVGTSDGKYMMSDVNSDIHFKSETEFEDRDFILEALGFPMGSVHKYAYGPGGDGLHAYRVIGVKRTLRLDPRDLTIYYSLPIYQVKMELVEDLTPDHHFGTNRGIKSDPFRYERFDSPKDTLYGCKRLDVSDHDYYIWKAHQEGKEIPAHVRAECEARRAARNARMAV